MNPKLFESKGHPMYLQFRFGEYVTRFQLSHQGEPVKIIFEKIKLQVKHSKNQQIVAETEDIEDNEHVAAMGNELPSSTH